MNNIPMDVAHDVVIIGAGLSGLAVAHFLEKRNPALNVLILEKNSRPGGAVRTFQEEGFLAEWGAHGFLDNVEESREILEDTGLVHEAQKAPLAEFVRYICLGGKLVLIPQHPKKIITAPLLPWTSKLRVLADLWKKPLAGEQTVGNWVAYRFGRALLPFVDAVFTGTYAGDFERLSIDAVMPGVRRLELKSGSVIRGLLKKRQQAKKRSAPKARTGLPSMISFPQGMTIFPEALARNKKICFRTEVSSIDKKDGDWRIRAGAATFRSRQLVVAIPVNKALNLLQSTQLAEKSPPPIWQIPEARIVTAVMGFHNSARIPFGFGYLAPEQEKRFALGALFSTHMFPGRAPDGYVMLEALIGGRRHPERIELTDDQLINNAYEDLRQLMRLPERPSFARVLRTPHGIPQLELGYPKLLAWRDELQHAWPGLHICGFGWGGIGINDMTKSSKSVAEAIMTGDASRKGKAAVKNVYF